MKKLFAIAAVAGCLIACPAVSAVCTGNGLNVTDANGVKQCASALPQPDGSQASVHATVAGFGPLAIVPASSTNGTALGTLPTGATGARFYLGASDSVTFTIASTAPSTAPALTFTISGAVGGTGPNWDENLAGGQMIYITATSGSPKFRWY